MQNSAIRKQQRTQSPEKKGKQPIGYTTPPRRTSGPSRRGWKVSPTREFGPSVQFECWDRDRNVSVRVRIRRFEIACLCLAFLCVVLSLTAGKLGKPGQELVVQLFGSLLGTAGTVIR